MIKNKETINKNGEEKFLWLAVTEDEYELPLCVEESAQELADSLGLKRTSIYTSIHNNLNGKVSGQRFVKVFYKNYERGY